MQEVNSLCTDSRALRAEYCIVGIRHNAAIYCIINYVLVFCCFFLYSPVLLLLDSTLEK